MTTALKTGALAIPCLEDTLVIANPGLIHTESYTTFKLVHEIQITNEVRAPVSSQIIFYVNDNQISQVEPVPEYNSKNYGAWHVHAKTFQARSSIYTVSRSPRIEL